MQCTHIYEGAKSGVPVNCGQCHACRVNRTSQWTLRMLYELGCWRNASFVTLTYNDENLPLDRGLHLSDFQKFKDNLRYNSNNRKFKYYHCGEYGDKNKRPHYHVILYGFDAFNKKDREIVYESWNKCESFFFDPLPRDFLTSKSSIGKGMLPVCREDIAYTAGYVQKKLTGELGKKEYGNKRVPYSTCSQGLGLQFAEANAERLRENKYTYLNGKRIGVPRYFRDKLGITFTNEDFKNQCKFVDEAWNKIFLAFSKAYPNLKPTDKCYERFFNNWYERRSFDLSMVLERDYLQKKRIRYGIE